MVPIMKNVSKLNKNTSMKLSTAAVVLLSALGVSTLANAAAPEHFISVAPGAVGTTQGNYNNEMMGQNQTIPLLLVKMRLLVFQKMLQLVIMLRLIRILQVKLKTLVVRQLLVLTRRQKAMVLLH